ncbi:MAG TPA: GTPase HflX [Lachnospiraceae bacterium]|jgi:GTP-binding protein HflX|nr:GTPase HflX [Lachnospiraceae bacterium]
MDTQKQTEKVILVGVSTYDHDDTEESVAELAELCITADAEVVGELIQNREQIHAATYLGKGKLLELKELIWECDATGIVCDDELSPVQLRNLSDELDVKVMDRTLVILDIFAKRAATAEGKIQVELAQLRYAQARLIGYGRSMSRLGGGIGTRGPGEKKLEVDRRTIKHRIAVLNQELNAVKKHREVTRQQRERNHIPVAAIVGYTNAGKSTLLNALTGSEVLSEDKLFATLDPTTRLLELPGKQQLLLTDTVGFIRKLPHHLIEAFRSTLEEAKYADIIIHVVDAANPQMDHQMFVVYQTLTELGVTDKPVVTLFNKQDLVEERQVLKDLKAQKTLEISAKDGSGLLQLQEFLVKLLQEKNILIERLFSYETVNQLQIIRKYGQMLQEDYRENGIYVKALVPKEWYEKVAK